MEILRAIHSLWVIDWVVILPNLLLYTALSLEKLSNSSKFNKTFIFQIKNSHQKMQKSKQRKFK